MNKSGLKIDISKYISVFTVYIWGMLLVFCIFMSSLWSTKSADFYVPLNSVTGVISDIDTTNNILTVTYTDESGLETNRSFIVEDANNYQVDNEFVFCTDASNNLILLGYSQEDIMSAGDFTNNVRFLITLGYVFIIMVSVIVLGFLYLYFKNMRADDTLNCNDKDTTDVTAVSTTTVQDELGVNDNEQASSDETEDEPSLFD
jgi:hypothetical protein